MLCDRKSDFRQVISFVFVKTEYKTAMHFAPELSAPKSGVHCYLGPETWGILNMKIILSKLNGCLRSYVNKKVLKPDRSQRDSSFGPYVCTCTLINPIYLHALPLLPMLQHGMLIPRHLSKACCQTSCAVLSHCFTDCTCALESACFV